MSEFFREHLINYKKKEWQKYANAQNEAMLCDQTFDLLSKMLKIDHTERIDAYEAIQHPYFDSVRNL